MKFLPWKDDDWFSRNGCFVPYDKAEHFLRETFTMFIGLFVLSIDTVLWILIVEVFGILYEMYNGYVPPINGKVEGFSWKDLIANNAGIAFMTILYFII